jgi:hypothetical protein
MNNSLIDHIYGRQLRQYPVLNQMGDDFEIGDLASTTASSFSGSLTPGVVGAGDYSYFSNGPGDYSSVWETDLSSISGSGSDSGFDWSWLTGIVAPAATSLLTGSAQVGVSSLAKSAGVQTPVMSSYGITPSGTRLMTTTGSQQIISGVSNTTLLLGAVVLGGLALIMMRK